MTSQCWHGLDVESCVRALPAPASVGQGGGRSVLSGGEWSELWAARTGWTAGSGLPSLSQPKLAEL